MRCKPCLGDQGDPKIPDTPRYEGVEFSGVSDF
jgi:hypothetical protein